MKRILLTAVSFSAITTFAQVANPNTGIQPTHGLQINTHGLKPKDTNQSKSSSGAATSPGHVGMPTGGSSASPGSQSAGGLGGSSQSSTTTTSPSTSGTGAGGIRGNAQNGGSTTTSTPSTGTSTVTPGDATGAVNQLLVKGITAAVSKVGVTDGYFGNPEIKIPLPPEIQQVGSLLSSYGAGALVDKLVMQLNRSAEQSASLAVPIFVNSISQITPSDAVNIITGQQQDAATQFLKRTTTEQLVVTFKPKVKSVLDVTKTSEAYADVMNLYNKIPFVSPVNADLNDYVTRKALDGLFIMVAKEEAKIRQNPASAGSSIITKVLGGILGQSSLAANKGVKANTTKPGATKVKH